MNAASQRTNGFKRFRIAIQISGYGVETTMHRFAVWLCRISAANSRQCYARHEADSNDERSGKHMLSPS
jgi:hypothetical protein